MNIVYKTTNTLNGKIYIGVHKCTSLEDGYIGCGIYKQSDAVSEKKKKVNSAFPSAVVKYGYDAFSREVLENFDTYQEALDREAELVNWEFVRRNDTYNCTNGGAGGDTFSCQTEEHKVYLRELSRQRALQNEEIKKTQFQNRTQEELTAMYAKSAATRKERGTGKGVKHSEEQIIKGARSQSKFIIIDAEGNEFQCPKEAAIFHGIKPNNAELRARRGNCGWSRRLKD